MTFSRSFALTHRYGIKHIVEFYASTEGNLALFNACDKARRDVTCCAM